MSTSEPTADEAPIQLNLTTAGWAVFIMLVASVFMASQARLAVGFMIPLVVAVVADVALSWHYVQQRSLSIAPLRTAAQRPDGLPLRVTGSGPDHPMQVTMTFRGGIDQEFALPDEPTTVMLPAAHTGVVNYVRTSTTCSMFGLGFARRWQTHRLPMLHWAPAPQAEQLETPAAVDEVARLRPYVPGDRMSRVSWPITARTGQMHVRSAGDGYEEFVIVLNLGRTTGPPGDGAVVDAAHVAVAPMTADTLERTLELAATLVTQLLQDGHQVRLVTNELTNDVHEIFRDVALSNPRYPAVLPDDTPLELVLVDRQVTDEDDLVRRLARAEPGAILAWPYGSWVDVSWLGIRTLP